MTATTPPETRNLPPFHRTRPEMLSASSLAFRSPRASLRALPLLSSPSAFLLPKRLSCFSRRNLLGSRTTVVNLPPHRLPLRCSLTPDPSSMSTSSNSGVRSVYDFVVKDARGNDVKLSEYEGKVLLIVNVASKCGLTNTNYSELTDLYDKYKGQGLEILAFPCNQFASQEPGTNDEIVEFACTRFKAEFPIFDKIEVNGDDAAPLYKFLKTCKGGILGDGIKWNFTKFLVDQKGTVVDRYAPTTSPSGIENDVKKLLGVS